MSKKKSSLGSIISFLIIAAILAGGVFAYFNWILVKGWFNQLGKGGSSDSPGEVVEPLDLTMPLASYTWEEISFISTNGLVDQTTWQIGDKITFTFSTNEETTVQILGFNHDDLSDGSGKAGITFGMTELLENKYRLDYVDTTGTNVNGWGNSNMRIQTMPCIFNTLPVDLQSAIKQVNKYTSAGGEKTDIVISEDKLFLFSVNELNVERAYASSEEGNPYEYWQKNNATAKKLSNGAGAASTWWLRSPSTASSTWFCHVLATGNSNVGAQSGYTSSGVCFGFCI